jgi:hypothetical protein
MDQIFLAMLAKLGVETVLDVIGSWKRSGMLSDEDIKALYINKEPEEYFEKNA